MVIIMGTTIFIMTILIPMTDDNDCFDDDGEGGKEYTDVVAECVDEDDDAYGGDNDNGRDVEDDPYHEDDNDGYYDGDDFHDIDYFDGDIIENNDDGDGNDVAGHNDGPMHMTTSMRMTLWCITIHQR